MLSVLFPVTSSDYETLSSSDTGYVSASVRRTNASGQANRTGLYTGTYFLKETKAPDGYQVNVDASGNVEVKEVTVSGGTSNVTLTNAENAKQVAGMVRSVARKLYELDSSIIEEMAKKNETVYSCANPVVSYDKKAIEYGKQLMKDGSIYISTGYSAYDSISIISALLRKYDLDITEDFVYSAMPSDMVNKEGE